MSEPISAVITGLVGALSAYMTYKVGIAQAQQKNMSVPAVTEQVNRGEEAHRVIETGFQKYGTDAERITLNGYYQDPGLYAEMLAKVLERIASRQPEFTRQLYSIAARTTPTHIASNHSGGIHGDVSGIAVTGVVHGSTFNVHQARRATDRELAELQIVMEATLSCITKGFFNKKEWNKIIPCHIQAKFRNKTTGHKEIIELFNGNLYLEQIEGTLWYNLARADLERLKSDTVDLLIALNRKGWDTVAITDYVDVNPKMSRFYMPSNPNSLYVFEPIKIESSTNPGSATIVVGGANLKSVP